MPKDMCSVIVYGILLNNKFLIHRMEIIKEIIRKNNQKSFMPWRRWKILWSPKFCIGYVCTYSVINNVFDTSMAKTRAVQKKNLNNTAPTFTPTVSSVQDVRNTLFGILEKR